MTKQDSIIKHQLTYLTNENSALTKIILDDIRESKHFIDPTKQKAHYSAIEKLFHHYITEESEEKKYSTGLIMSSINILNQIYKDNSISEKNHYAIQALLERTSDQFAKKVITTTFLDQINAALKHNPENSEHHKYLFRTWDEITRTAQQDATLTYEIENPIGITELFTRFGIFQLEKEGVPQDIIYLGITKIPQYISSGKQDLLEGIQYRMAHRIKERIYQNNFDLMNVQKEEREFLFERQPL